ncbi:hypothetical protein ACQ4PT_011840 [Festuca glaucescens]
MHGQQGVVGFLESRDNFPFTCQGIVPDVVINPHAFPTRQTPGQLLKATLEKGITLGGKIRYATPFTTPSVEVISQQLHKAGFQRWGDESVVNGRTGERMKSVSDFHGPCLLPKADTHVRRQGEISEYRASAPLTRQPVADRQRFGGVKFGEMERDCLLAHGAAANLHQRLFMLGDFSETCERVANVIVRPVQRDSENKIRIVVPYGAKLFYQELFSWGSASSSRWKSARTPSSGRIVYVSSISV